MDNELKNTDMYIDVFTVDLLVYTISVLTSFLLPFFSLLPLPSCVLFLFLSLLLLHPAYHLVYIFLWSCWLYAFGMRISWSISLWSYVCGNWMKNLWDYRMDLCVFVHCHSFCLVHTLTVSLSVLFRFCVSHPHRCHRCHSGSKRTRDHQRTDWQWQQNERETKMTALKECLHKCKN